MPLAYIKKQKLLLVPAKDQVMIQGNKVLLFHLFQNLIENAIKYTQVNGKISVKISLHSANVVIAIQDNGIGIPLEHQKKIFQRFYQVNTARSGKNGHGLGLALCQSIIRAHHGYLRMSSKDGRGTIFFVTLLTC